MHSKFKHLRPYSLREGSVAVGLEDFFLCRWIFGLRIPCTEYRSVCLVRNT